MKNIDTYTDIVTKCANGELEHNQGSYFCGTAACIAGWRLCLDYSVEPDVAEKESLESDPTASEYQRAVDDPWIYYEDKDEINPLVAKMIFDVTASFQLQLLTLGRIKEGHTISISKEQFEEQSCCIDLNWTGWEEVRDARTRDEWNLFYSVYSSGSHQYTLDELQHCLANFFGDTVKLSVNREYRCVNMEILPDRCKAYFECLK